MTDTRTRHHLVASNLIVSAIPEPVRAMAERLRQARLSSADPAVRARAQAEEAARKVVEQVKLEPVKQEPDSTVDPDSMTAVQAARYLNVTVDQVRGLASDGALRWFNTSRGDKRARYRFKQSDLDQFIADRTVQGAEQCPSTPRRSTKASTSSISSSKVIGFMDRRAAHLAEKQKNSKL